MSMNIEGGKGGKGGGGKKGGGGGKKSSMSLEGGKGCRGKGGKGGGGKKGGCRDKDDDVNLSCQSEITLPTGAMLSVELDLSDVDGIGPVIRRMLQDESSFQRMLQMQIPCGQVDISTGGEVTSFAHITYVIDVSCFGCNLHLL